MVCSGNVGAVYCIEASRLARNGRDWHHLIDLCALAGALVIDPDGAYDPRLVNDRLLLGLKGTMSEYELSLMRQRGIAARDSKARRGEYRFMLPPGFCWSETGKIEIDPDEHVVETIRLVFAKFRELGSARQVFLWLRSADHQDARRSAQRRRLQADLEGAGLPQRDADPAQSALCRRLCLRPEDPANAHRRRYGRARSAASTSRERSGTSCCATTMPATSVGRTMRTITELLLENAHMKKNCARKSARGGRALLTGLMRCGRCGRMMRVFYGQAKGHAHRYQCRGDDAHVGAGMCIGIGGLRIDRAVASQILEAVSDHAVEAAMFAADQVDRSHQEVAAAIERELEGARYEASSGRTPIRARGSGQTPCCPRAGSPLERRFGTRQSTGAEA